VLPESPQAAAFCQDPSRAGVCQPRQAILLSESQVLFRSQPGQSRRIGISQEYKRMVYQTIVEKEQ